MRFLQTKLLLILCTIFTGLTAFAQHDTITRIQAIDSAKNYYVDSLRKLGSAVAKRNKEEFQEERISTRQYELIESLKKTVQASKEYLKTGIDTSDLDAALAKVKNWYSIAGDGVFTNIGTTQTHRNLETSEGILKYLLDRTLTRKSALDTYHKDLIDLRNKIDSLISDSVIYKFPSDSATLTDYVQDLVAVTNELTPTYNAFKKTLASVEVLQDTVNWVINRLNSSIEQIDAFEKDLSGKTFDREFTNLGGPAGFSRPFGEIIGFSQIKGRLALIFYAGNNRGLIFLLVVLILAATFFLNNLKQNLRSQKFLRQDFSGQLVLRYPFLSAIMIILNLFQFIFTDPPFIFNAILWAISSICLTIIFRNFITKYWMQVWLALFAFFLLASLDNQILQASQTERWMMLLLATVGAVSCTIIVLKGRKQELKEKWIMYFIGFVAVIELASVIANVYGRYNLSKTLLTSAFFSVVIAILLLWTVRLVNEGLSLASLVYKRPEKKILYINFQRVGKRAPLFFYVLLIIGWLILFMRNFYLYRFITDPIRSFIAKERTVGHFTFTVQSMLVFFLILILSAVISKIVSFFATEQYNTQDSTEKKAGIGSWLLLIRISIIAIGTFFAFAAAGIPMDKITVIVGALGVGIGFGLQALVNNLVSGLIISFEKPINVGDIVEVGGQSGIVKSIGFRSSVISTGDGSDVVIPNGDLLNQHLVNWTMNDNTKRVDILVGVAYGTDLEKAKQILKDLMAKEERILQDPGSDVFIQDFDKSSIAIQLFFWVSHINESQAVKSDIISAIDIAFKENGIEIPFPQQDLHIRSVSNGALENKKDKDPDQ